MKPRIQAAIEKAAEVNRTLGYLREGELEVGKAQQVLETLDISLARDLDAVLEKLRATSTRIELM